MDSSIRGLVEERTVVTSMNPMPDLKGDRGPSKAILWLLVPLVLASGIKVVAHVAHEFDASVHDGIMALVAIVVIFFGGTAILVSVGAFLEVLMIARARRAAGHRDLLPMNLSVNSYQQAFHISGKVAFLPKKHQGVFVALRPYEIELYAGFRRYDGPLLRIRYSDILSLRRETLQLFGGKEPGLVIETVNGPFELGFVRAAVLRPFSISKKQAEMRFKLFESALAKGRQI